MTSITAPVATPKIVGKALYLELIANPELPEEVQKSLIGWQHKGTKQIIIFPEYQDDLGTTRGVVALTRVVSSYTPRSQWDINNLRHNPKPIQPSDLEAEESAKGYYNDYLTLDTYKKDEWDELPIVAKNESKKLALELFLRGQLIETTYEGEGEDRVVVAKQAWIVRDSKPFAVEITDEDMTELHRHSKTPQAVIRRINKVRDSITTFPKKLV